MKFGEFALKRLRFLAFLFAALALAGGSQAALAVPAAELEAIDSDSGLQGTEPAEQAGEAASGYTPLGPEMIVGQPTPGALGFQSQHTPNGEFALWMHDAILLPIITVICLFVLGLLLWVIVRYNKRANAVPSKTSHNTFIEIVWTVIPVLILVVIAVPSITLLARQYESPPEDALTIKATGYQWYWGYTYSDNGGFEVISNMMPEADAIDNGLPPQLAVDNRMVVPVGEPIRIQTFGADVIHSFGIPSLWFKLDAVPGRLNEKMLLIDEPGIYYGQCMELCGIRHGYMPIAIEAVPRPQFEAWVRSKGGTIGDEVEAEAATEEAETEAEAADVEGGEAAEETDAEEAAGEVA